MGQLTIDDTVGLVKFVGNEAKDSGGAIWAQCLTVEGTSMCSNGALTFESNSSQSNGGAIYVSGKVAMNQNTVLTFSKNQSEKCGGAIYAASGGSGTKTMDISGHSGSVVFENNEAVEQGGAIYVRQDYSVSFEDNNSVVFRGNSASDGGAIYVYYGYNTTLRFNGNASLLFENNHAEGKGGAILHLGGQIIDNTSVVFSNNDAAYGGAICASYNPIYIEGNGSITFSGNHAQYGGAIYVESSALNICGNTGDVLFQDNYVCRYNDEGTLESIVLNSTESASNSGKNYLAAKEGKSIIFADASTRQSTDNWGVTELNRYTPVGESEAVVTQGNIVFTGKDARTRLASIWKANGLTPEGSAFESALKDSVVSELDHTTLYGGTLSVEDGAEVKVGYFYAKDGSTLRLNLGTIHYLFEQYHYHDYPTFESGATLLVENSAKIEDSGIYGLLMDNGSSLNFRNAELTVNGKLIIGRNSDARISACLSGYGIGEHMVLQASTALEQYGSLVYSHEGEWTESDDRIYYLIHESATSITAKVDKSHATLDWSAGTGNWEDAEWTVSTPGVDVPEGDVCLTDNHYYDGDKVTFTQGGNVTIKGTVSPADIAVSGSGNLVWLGNGRIAGAGKLTKNGSGKLSISTANTYTGGTVLNGGVLEMKHVSALGKGDVALNGGTLVNGTGSASSISSGVITLNGGALSGNFTTEGSSSWVLCCDTELTGSLTLGGGSLTMKDNAGMAVSGTLYLDDVTLTLSGNYEAGESYTLISAGSISGDTSGIVLLGVENYTLSTQNGALTLVMQSDSPIDPGPIVPPSGAKSLTWANAKKAVWQEGAGGWVEGEAFSAGDHVSFADGNVTIVGEVEPGEVTISATKSLTFKADKKNPGRIAGETSVTIDAAPKAKVTMNDGNTYTGGTTIEGGSVKAGGASSFGSGAITLNGGTLDLAGKAIDNAIVLDGAAVIKGGAKYTGDFSMGGDAELLKGSVVNIAADKMVTLAGGTVNGTLSGKGSILVTGDVTLGDTGKLTVDMLGVGGGVLNVGAKGLALNAKSSNLYIGNEGELVTKGKLSGLDLGMHQGTLTVEADKPVQVSFKGGIIMEEQSEMWLNGKLSAGSLSMMDSSITLENEKPQSIALTQAKTAAGEAVENALVNSHISANGSMSVAGDMYLLSGSTIHLKDANREKPKALGLTVKGGLYFDQTSTLTLSGALSVKDMLLYGGTINMTSTKPQTIKVSNNLVFGQLADFNFNFDVSAKDVGKKSFKIITFKNAQASNNLKYDSLEELLGLEDAGCTLTIDAKSISLVVYDLDAWNAAKVSDEDVEFTQESPAAVTALVNPALPDYSGVANALVQANWGLVESSRAFVNTIANRSMAVQLGSGERAVWASAIAGSSRRSSSGTHGGADTNITGGAIGMETQVGENSLLGMALGNSWTRVSAHNYGTIKQDTTHLGVYGQTNWNKLSADWSAAYGRSESKFNGSDWSQRAIQLDGRLSYNHALSETVLLRGFGGVQYYASDSARVDGIDTGEVQNLRGEIGVGIVRSTQKSSVYAELALHQDLVRDNPEVTSPFGQRYHGTNPGRTGINFTIGGSYALSDQWSVNASYTAEVVENANAHSVNVGATYKF